MADGDLVSEVVARVADELGLDLSPSAMARVVTSLAPPDEETFVPCEHDGKPSTWHYQQGCRGTKCKAANSAYYKAWRAKKRAEKAKSSKPAKVVVRKRRT